MLQKISKFRRKERGMLPCRRILAQKFHLKYYSWRGCVGSQKYKIQGCCLSPMLLLWGVEMFAGQNDSRRFEATYRRRLQAFRSHRCENYKLGVACNV